MNDESLDDILRILSKVNRHEDEYTTLDVSWKGADGTIRKLNSRLISERGLEQDEVDALKETHIAKEELFAQMADCKEPEKLRQFAAENQDIEFSQQAIWRFDLNPQYHYWWLVPQCSCPNLNNKDAHGSSINHVSSDCIIHGTDALACFDEETGWEWYDR